MKFENKENLSNYLNKRISNDSLVYTRDYHFNSVHSNSDIPYNNYFTNIDDAFDKSKNTISASF